MTVGEKGAEETKPEPCPYGYMLPGSDFHRCGLAKGHEGKHVSADVPEVEWETP